MESGLKKDEKSQGDREEDLKVLVARQAQEPTRLQRVSATKMGTVILATTKD